LTPNLERLVVPQDVLFDHTKRIIELPETIRTLEIIDSDFRLHEWARQHLNKPDKLLSLKEVKLWCDKNPYPFIRGTSRQTSVPDTHTPTFGTRFLDNFAHGYGWHNPEKVEDSIWDELRVKRGIILVLEEDSRTKWGWRRMGNYPEEERGEQQGAVGVNLGLP
jgi:hypothetical protein